MENKTIKRILTGLTVVLMLIGVVVSAISIHYGDTPGERESMQLGIIAYNAEANACQCNPEKSVDEFEKEAYTRVMNNINNAAGTSIGWAKLLTYIAIFVLLGFIVMKFVTMVIFVKE